jgi:hypothetical protein
MEAFHACIREALWRGCDSIIDGDRYLFCAYNAGLAIQLTLACRRQWKKYVEQAWAAFIHVEM